MSLTFHKIRFLIVLLLLGTLPSLVESIKAHHHTYSSHKSTAQKVKAKNKSSSWQKSLLEKTDKKKRIYEKILIWGGGTVMIIGIVFLAIYTSYSGSKDQRNAALSNSQGLTDKNNKLPTINRNNHDTRTGGSNKSNDKAEDDSHDTDTIPGSKQQNNHIDAADKDDSNQQDIGNNHKNISTDNNNSNNGLKGNSKENNDKGPSENTAQDDDVTDTDHSNKGNDDTDGSDDSSQNDNDTDTEYLNNTHKQNSIDSASKVSVNNKQDSKGTENDDKDSSSDHSNENTESDGINPLAGNSKANNNDSSDDDSKDDIKYDNSDDDHITDKDNSNKQNTGTETSIHPVGLPNIGNTCFMNAALQPLLNIIPNILGIGTVKEWQKIQNYDDNVDSNLLKTFSDLVMQIVNQQAIGNQSLEIEEEIKKLGTALTNATTALESGKQEDAAVAITTIIPSLNDSLQKKTISPYTIFLNRDILPRPIQEIKKAMKPFEKEVAKKESIVGNLFYSTVVGTFQCAKCGFTELRLLRALEFKLPVIYIYNNNTKITELKEALREFEKTKKISGAGYFLECDCKGKEKKSASIVIIQQKILIPANILIFHLDRFNKPDKDSNNNQNNSFNDKQSHYINAPDNLKVQEFEYKKIGIGVHVGSGTGLGHYISYVEDLKTKSWWELNDNVANTVNITSVESDMAQNSSSVNTPIFFIYKRKGLRKLRKGNSKNNKIKLKALKYGTSIRLKTKEELKKSWNNFIKIIIKSENLGKILQDDMLITLKKNLTILKNNTETLAKTAEEVINRKRENISEISAAINQQGISQEIRQQADQKIDNHKAVIKVCSNLLNALKSATWENFLKENSENLYTTFLKNIKATNTMYDPGLIEKMSEELKRWDRVAYILTTDRWEEVTSLCEEVIKSAEKGILWLQKKVNTEKNLLEDLVVLKRPKKVSKPQPISNIEDFKSQIVKALLSLKEVILAELQSSKPSKDSLEDRINGEGVELKKIAIIYYAINKTASQKKYKNKLYEYLDLIDYGLIKKLGYVAPLF